jgi:hypothetical protein
MSTRGSISAFALRGTRDIVIVGIPVSSWGWGYAISQGLHRSNGAGLFFSSGTGAASACNARPLGLAEQALLGFKVNALIGEISFPDFRRWLREIDRGIIAPPRQCHWRPVAEVDADLSIGQKRIVCGGLRLIHRQPPAAGCGTLPIDSECAGPSLDHFRNVRFSKLGTFSFAIWLDRN